MIIKEFVRKENSVKPYRVIIREDNYGSKLSKFIRFATEARKDFDINEDQVDIVHFGGQHYSKTFGIEFDTATVPPPEYSEIPLLELLK